MPGSTHLRRMLINWGGKGGLYIIWMLRGLQCITQEEILGEVGLFSLKLRAMGGESNCSPVCDNCSTKLYPTNREFS